MTAKLRFSAWRALLAAVAAAALATSAAAQDKPAPAPTPVPPGAPSVSGLPTTVPVMPSRPPAQPDKASAFVTGLSTTDAVIEIVAGQARILTTASELTVPGRPQGVISVGDPTIADVTVLTTRTLRLVGNRLGLTDLTIVTPNNQVYAFDIRVVPDLDTLRLQLKALYPQTNLEISLIREHLAVKGCVATQAERRKILETIQAYLNSVATGLQRNVSQETRGRGRPGDGRGEKPGEKPEAKKEPGDGVRDVTPEERAGSLSGTIGQPKVIDLILVTPEVEILQRRLASLFPDAAVKASLTEDKRQLVLEGQARDAGQVARIVEIARAHVDPERDAAVRSTGTDTGGALQTSTTEVLNPVQQLIPIVNLIRVPSSQQVLLKVRVAELNRTAMREVGSDFLAFDPSTGSAVGTGLGSATIQASGGLGGVSASAAAVPGRTTAFAILGKSNFEIFFNALRRNQLLKILAEPNLVAINGQRANFLAGGQFFIPVAQNSNNVGGGAGGGITAQPVDFGVRLDFLAHILDDDVIRLTVNPEVSQPDFSVATSFVAGGSPVPGLNKRSAHTTVELRQGQTLAIAGLMQVTLDGTTNRIPGLGDLPIIGTFFSNTTGSRTEKELIVLVTPYLVEPLNPGQVGPLPGDEVKGPTDLEFYLLSRMEGRTGFDFRATTEYDDAAHVIRRLLRLHDRRFRGAHGYCD